MDDSMRNLAFASLLAGGLLIVVGGFGAALMMASFGGLMGYGMMQDYAGYVAPGWLAGMAWWMGVVGLVTGGIVLFAAFRLRQAPDDAVTAGTLGVVGGALSLLAMGGWFLGAALAILGGVVALAGRPRPAAPRQG